MEKRSIVLDCETTGLDWAEDEILQLSIIDDEKNVLMDRYFRPSKKTSWEQAEAVNHISPKDVENCPSISELKDEIQKIVDSAEVIIGYNTQFDLKFLQSIGIELHDQLTVDVMRDFSPIYGEFNEKYGTYKWQKLTKCAEYYGYTWEENAHNSLGDTYATLYCHKKIEKIKLDLKEMGINEELFSDLQMHEIYHGLEIGLTEEQIQMYADPRFDEKQMGMIRGGLENGFTLEQVQTYADPSIDYESMSEIRLNLENEMSLG